MNLVDDKERGFYEKFIVKRSDGSSEPGGRHARCSYFVIDIEHDPNAAQMLAHYAWLCCNTHPKLAKDLSLIVRKLQK